MNWHPALKMFVLSASLLLMAPLSFASEETKPPRIFSNAAEMKITLSGPWRTIRRNKKQDKPYPVKLIYTGSDREQHELDVNVAPRGITRRLYVCKFPPLKIHFDKEDVKGTEFRGNKSLKMVTYCQNRNQYEQYYVSEYLIYRIYNLITEYSFRVKPLSVEYRDSEKDGKPVTRFGFLIEDIDDVAKRNDLEKLAIAKVPYAQLDPVTSSNFSLFQFMIGNLDWAATSGPKQDSCCHNSRLIGAGDELIPKYGVPYDFDSSGLVNAHYAAPPDGLKVRDIRQRLYRGFCLFNDALPQAVERFNEKKADILGLFENNPHLMDKTRQNSVAYIEGFYRIINDPERFKKDIIDKCRG